MDAVRHHLIDSEVNPSLRIGGIVINQHNKQRILSRELYDLLKDSFGDTVFKTVIRINVALSEAQAEAKDIFSYDPESNGAKDYGALTQEFIDRFTK